MAIDQTSVVDAIGVDKVTGNVVLTITDHIEWTGHDDEHLFLLQEKLNTYLTFVESGEFVQTYPDAKDREVLIDVVCKYPLTQQARNFYQRIASIIEQAGMKVQYRLFDASIESDGSASH